ncbi:MAG: dihydrolipoamide dehydrogenase [Rhodobacteraceae bacterium PARR1]|nr:MAG: dihydrolipoamide dehydrogenase [Rhodobacteraceae bacterium PARR1]
MRHIETDLCVIGAGSGGLSVAAGAVQMGARVVLIEAGEMGGDCLNAGCVPSKALLAAAKAAHAARGGRFGVTGQATVDFAAAKDHVAATIATIAPHDSQERFEGLGVHVIRDWARFISATEVVAGQTTIRARRFVIATGSRAVIPPIPGIESVIALTNETIFALRECPRHLLILGGGPIGLEMALAHRRLGAEVTVVEATRCLSREDPEAAALVVARLRAEGVTILEGQAVAQINAEGGVTLHLADGSTVSGSHLLVAAGRASALDRLDLTAAKVAFTAQGVTVGDNLTSTTNRRVMAVGDAAGRGQFTHLAAHHAGLVIRRAVLGLPAKLRADHIPRVTFTDPELAQVGPTEAEARKTYRTALTVLRADYSGNDRAIAEGATTGFVKILAHKGRIIGATAVGVQAGEVMAPLTLAVSSRLKLSALAGVVLPYPTLSELGKRAAGAYFSPKLFDNPALKGWVRLVQRLLP